MSKNNMFYCYSYQLMLFLKLQNINYKNKFKCKNEKHCWIYEPNPQLSQALTDWNVYKKSFLNSSKEVVK